jgi:hypothetical protein
VSLQNNILALKEGMQKVIASLIVQRHISNGTIKMMNGTRSLQESVRLAVNKVSGQNPKVAPLTESIIKEELPESGTSIGPPRPVPSSTVLPPSVSPILQPDSTTDAAPPMPPVSAPSKKKKKK